MAAFDVNLILGTLGWRPIGTGSADEMLRTMDRFGMEAGLVCHLTACLHDPATGDAALFDAVHGRTDRLWPTPVVDLNDDGAWLATVDEWAARGARALRLAPAFYRHPVTGEAATKLAAVAVDHAWPVTIAMDTVRGVPWVSGQPRQAIEFARAYPEVSVIVIGANRGHWHEIVPALANTVNMYLDLSNIETGLALEGLVAAGVRDRLVHGSGYGVSYANVCLERVQHSSLTEDAKHAILYGNAGRLFGLAPVAG